MVYICVSTSSSVKLYFVKLGCVGECVNGFESYCPKIRLCLFVKLGSINHLEQSNNVNFCLRTNLKDTRN